MSRAGGLGRRLDRLEAEQPKQDPFAEIARARLASWDDYGRRYQNTYEALCRSRAAGEELCALDTQILGTMDEMAQGGDVMAPTRETLEQLAREGQRLSLIG